MRRMRIVLALVAMLFFVAVPVLAEVIPEEPAVEEAPEPEGVPEAIGVGTGNELTDAFLNLGWMITLVPVLNKITERLVSWFSFLKGDIITAVSVAVGSALAWYFSLDPSTAIAEAVGVPGKNLGDWANYLISGFLIAIAAGKMADREELKYGQMAGAQGVTP